MQRVRGTFLVCLFSYSTISITISCLCAASPTVNSTKTGFALLFFMNLSLDPAKRTLHLSITAYGSGLTVEFNILGRILPQMEQASAHIPPPTRLRHHDHILPALSLLGDVRHFLAERCGARAGHGSRNPEDSVCLLVYFLVLWSFGCYHEFLDLLIGFCFEFCVG